MKDSFDVATYNEDEEWQLPIPKHHTVAICILLTISLLTAVFLPSPNRIQPQTSSWSSTGRLPDGQQTYSTVAVFEEDLNATESIDSEQVDDSILFDKNTSFANAGETEWFEQNVQPGDTMYNIFHTLNLQYETLQRLEKSEPYGKYLNDIKPGDKIYVQLDKNNELQGLIKPYDYANQLHFTRVAANRFEFTATIEPLDPQSPDSPEDEENKQVTNTPAKEKVTVTKDPLVANLPSPKEVVSTPRITKTKHVADAKLLAKAEAKKAEVDKLAVKATKVQKEKIRPPKRTKLMKIVVQSNETFLTAGERMGLSTREMRKILKQIKGRYNPSKLQVGDELRVLFASAKENAQINAIYVKGKRFKFALFRNSTDGKFYAENDVIPTVTVAHQSSAFNRYPVSAPRITSNFNPYRRHPITGRVRPHKGTDFGVKIGTPVYAPASGVITRSTYQHAAGHYIVIQHEGAYSSYSTVYMHLSRKKVNVGDRVRKGQVIALSGNSGASTGPHLHYELRRNGTPIDAMKANIISGKQSIAHQSLPNSFLVQIKSYKKQLGL